MKIIGIVGLGYVGRPLGRAFYNKGATVIGVDIKDIDETFTVTKDYNQLRSCDAIIITVPTPLLEGSFTPDLSFIEASCTSTGKVLRKGQLVILESTTYPGTTREIVVPILEKESGLSAKEDFYVAYSPERVDPTELDKWPIEDVPRVLGGYTEKALYKAIEVYSIILKKIHKVSSCEVAEASKLLENSFRAVNIAFVNELKPVFSNMDIDIKEVIDAAKTKPFGYLPFYPSLGVGGHCIPVDPWYLSYKVSDEDCYVPSLIENSCIINERMYFYVLTVILKALNYVFGKKKVLIVGVAYKPDIDDDRNSPSYKLIKSLEEQNVKVDYHDPYIPEAKGMESVSLDNIEDYDCVVLCVAHHCLNLSDIAKRAKCLVDTTNSRWLKSYNNHYYAA